MDILDVAGGGEPDEWIPLHTPPSSSSATREGCKIFYQLLYSNPHRSGSLLSSKLSDANKDTVPREKF